METKHTVASLLAKIAEATGHTAPVKLSIKDNKMIVIHECPPTVLSLVQSEMSYESWRVGIVASTPTMAGGLHITLG